MMIIDSHQHLGQSMFSGVATDASDLIRSMNAHGVDAMLVMPQPTQESIPQVHDRIAAAAAAHPGQIYGMASIDPWLPDGQYEAEARRCVRDLGFVGLKLHPLAHRMAPNGPEAEKVFRMAAELAVPVIVHTGLGSPWSLPSLCIPPALKYPSVPVILAHAGWGIYTNEAMVAAEVCGNIYLEPSWCPTYMVKRLIERHGPQRVLFGSDHLTNLPVELTKYRSIGLTETALSWVLCRTALSIFRLSCGVKAD